MQDRLAGVRDQALEVGRGWAGPDTPTTWQLTAALFEGLAADGTLLELASEIPSDRLPPLLFVASVQLVASRHPDEPFSHYFPRPGGGQPDLDEQFAGRYRAFCLEHRQELEPIWAKRRYQMSEVARTTQIAFGLDVVARLRPGRPVALVDVGTGAGFGLYPDRYRYRLSDGREFGAAGSPVALSCELVGARRPTLPVLPPITSRVGLDVDPIDLDDAAAREWLLACLPPEVGALERVVAATDIARRGGAEIVRGAVEHDLADLLDALTDESVACVVDSYTSVFLDDAARRRVLDVIDQVSAERDVAWIALDPLVPLGTEARWTVQGQAAPPDLVTENRRGVFAVLSVVAHLAGSSTTHLLATAHPSGTRMAWLDDATSERAAPAAS